MKTEKATSIKLKNSTRRGLKKLCAKQMKITSYDEMIEKMIIVYENQNAMWVDERINNII